MTALEEDLNRDFPIYSRGEYLADMAAHVLGLTVGLVAAIALLIEASHFGQPLLLIGAGLYGLGLVAMLSCSAAYNLCPPSPLKSFLRKLDHAAIFIMIAGTYTPLLLNRVGGDWGLGLLSFVWLVAFGGAFLKIMFPRRWEMYTIALYVGLGWSILVAINPLLRSVSVESLILIGAGGVVYSIGVIFHLWDRLPYQNAIWHWLVLIAASCHYIAIMNEVAIAGTIVGH